MEYNYNDNYHKIKIEQHNWSKGMVAHMPTGENLLEGNLLH
jgi:hypothetical protein